ncbi:MAG: hypothetical protein IJ409_09605 [Lachnospiraceae bacterium]|nr:hypothetical protein [Lachnospiraceae bacterium]
MKKTQGGVKALVIGIILMCLILGYYYYLSNKETDVKEEADVTVTAVQEVLMKNLDSSYPPSPREVLKYYGELVQCLHNETYTEEEFLKLAAQAQQLYDDELVANQTQEQYIQDLQWDINNMKQQEIVISSYTPSSSTDVDYFDADGYSWAKLNLTFTLRQGTALDLTEETFLLRKDTEGHWKIYGWKLTEDVISDEE